MKKTFVYGGAVIMVGAIAVFFFLQHKFKEHDIARTPQTTEAEAHASLQEAPPADGMVRYEHPTHSFTLDVPKGMRIERFEEAGGAETISFETPAAEPPRDFQLYIVPYHGTQIASSQIVKDTHGSALGIPEEVVLGGGVRGIIFESEHPMLGKLREVWFLTDGYLVEATTYTGNDTWFADILDTLRPDTQ